MAKSFKQLTTKDDNTILVVDALNLAFRYKHQKKRDFADDYVRTVQSLAASYNAGTILITADWGSSSYRKNLLPEYKQNRKDKYAQQTEQEAEDFAEFMDDYEVTLITLEQLYPVFRYKNVEADDIAAYLVSKLWRNNSMWLISSDRDWDLLIKPTVSRFSYVTRKEVTSSNWSEHYEVDQEDYISFKCLTGDTGDNVPGIPGVGPKRAAALIQMYGSAMDIADAMPLEGKYKYIQSTNEFGAEGIMKNYELMDLVAYCEDAVGVDNVRDINERIKS
jgi:5'-3' exonuclease|tara:strand:+ start:157 stop:987 length:831 start_codon:yes stop_codon:yes gene_type:complete